MSWGSRVDERRPAISPHPQRGATRTKSTGISIVKTTVDITSRNIAKMRISTMESSAMVVENEK